MRRLAFVVVVIATSVAALSAQRQAKTFDICVVDVEGGNASLFPNAPPPPVHNGGAYWVKVSRTIVAAHRNHRSLPARASPARHR